MNTSRIESKLLQIARICHEANRAYCESLGDHSQPTWDLAPQWQKESAMEGVRFHLMNPFAGPEASHEVWLKHKQRHGWRLGEKKDEIKKTHPCMVPFYDLPREQQAKDYIFRAIVHAAKCEIGRAS